jgi:hypothetical protein
LYDRYSIPGTGNIFSILNNIQTVSEAHPVSYMKGTEGFFPEGKVAGA